MAGEFSLEIGSDIFPEPGEGIQDPTYLQLRKFHNGGGVFGFSENLNLQVGSDKSRGSDTMLEK